MARGIQPGEEQRFEESRMEIDSAAHELVRHDLVELRLERRIAMNVAGALASIRQEDLRGAEELLMETEGMFAEWFARDLEENKRHRAILDEIEGLKQGAAGGGRQ